MPARQPSPGPSSLPAPAVLKPLNTRKRAVSDLLPEGDPSQPAKKSKKDLELSDADKAPHSKENKKKRKKKKKKSPLTAAPGTDHDRALSQSKPSVLVATPACPVPLLGAPARLRSATIDSVKHDESGDQIDLSPAENNEERVQSPSGNKGKARAVSEQTDPLVPQSIGSALTPPTSQPADSMNEALQSKIAELDAQLQSQKQLLSRYADNLSNLQQSLTCQICLDLLHKPFALAPCGHVTCYLCLIRWFTSVQDNHNVNSISQLEDVPRLLTSRTATRGVYLRKRKTCPLCRAAVTERPTEIWSIKSMVASLVKSNLVDLPSPPSSDAEAQNDNGNTTTPRQVTSDPWRNIFRKSRETFPPPIPEGNQEVRGPEEMGMWDEEDSVYRCLDCMHEIWGGLCTNCNRDYPGHARLDDGDSGSDEDGIGGGPREHFLRRRLREIWDGYRRHDLEIGWDEEADAPVDMLWGPYLEGFDSSDDSMEDDLSDQSQLEDEALESDSAEDTSLDDEGSWVSTDDDDDDSNSAGNLELAVHYEDLIRMQNNVPHWPFGQHFPLGEEGVAHIEEVADDAEEEDPLSDSHSHSESEEDRYEQDSFIDDDEEAEEEEDSDDEEDLPVIAINRHTTRNRGRQREELELSNSDSDSAPLHSEDDNDSNVVDYRAVVRRLGRGTRLGGAGVNGRSRRRIQVVTDEEPGDDLDDEIRGPSSEDDGVREAGRRHGVSTRRNYVNESSNEE